jgi:hypothetical protein
MFAVRMTRIFVFVPIRVAMVRLISRLVEPAMKKRWTIFGPRTDVSVLKKKQRNGIN